MTTAAERTKNLVEVKEYAPRDVEYVTTAAEESSKAGGKTGLVWAALRLAMGWTFFWAFADKLFGLGYATEAGKGWIDGESPTFGFLNFASRGPLAETYKASRALSRSNGCSCAGTARNRATPHARHRSQDRRVYRDRDVRTDYT